jgi:hypothetical protein
MSLTCPKQQNEVAFSIKHQLYLVHLSRFIDTKKKSLRDRGSEIQEGEDMEQRENPRQVHHHLQPPLEEHTQGQKRQLELGTTRTQMLIAQSRPFAGS